MHQNNLPTRNTWLAKPCEAGAGWKALFTCIVAWNEEIKRFLTESNYFYEHGLFEVPQASLRLKIYFWRDEMNNVREALWCSINLFPTENYFTAATKHVISSM